MSDQLESQGKYPAPHEDEDDTCQCPDHVVMRITAQQLRLQGRGWVRAFITGTDSHE